MRSLFLSSLAACIMAPAAWGCDLYPTSRPEDVTGYVANAVSCLERPPEPVSFDTAAEAEFAARINTARAAEGLPALAVRPELRPAARFHSLDQIWNGTFGHAGAAGRSQGDRISALDRTLVRSFAAENVAQASGDYNPAIVPSLLHNGLMESPGHRRNILAEDATHMAIGVARLRDALVVTQLFVREEGQLLRPAPTVIAENLGTDDAYLNEWHLYAVRSGPSPENDAAGCLADCPNPLVSVIEVEGRMPLEDRNGYRAISLSGPSWDTRAPPRDMARPPTALRARSETP